jgi:hypothetical protein
MARAEHARHQDSIDVDTSFKGDRISRSSQAIQHPGSSWLFPTVDRHAERSIVEKAANKGGEDWELRQGPAFGDISDAGEGRVVGKWDFCIQLSISLPSLTVCNVPLSLVTKHWVRNSCMGVLEPCGKSSTSQLPYRILKTYPVNGRASKGG